MAKKVEIEITIGPTGEVSLEVDGVVGKRCVDLAKPFEDAIGEVASRDLKPAYHRTVASTVKTRTG